MNKKNTRKGFTIVELVIVIAVIAILATVLIPTFGNIIEKANKSAALQEARIEFTEYMIDTNAQGEDNLVIESGDYYFAVVGGELQDTAYEIKELTADKDDAMDEFPANSVLATTTVENFDNIWVVTVPET